MTKIARKTMKQFGSTALSNQIGEFGSFAAGAPAYTTDPAVIQSLTNYLGGWFSAIVGASNPAMEDLNALCFLFAYQLCYLMQAGVAEWDSATTYFTGSLVQSGGIDYVSLVDNNFNNAVTNPTYWAAPLQNGSLTPNSASANTNVASGTTLTWPFLTIPLGVTVTVASGGTLFVQKNLTVLGTLTVNGSLYVI